MQLQGTSTATASVAVVVGGEVAAGVVAVVAGVGARVQAHRRTAGRKVARRGVMAVVIDATGVALLGVLAGAMAVATVRVVMIASVREHRSVRRQQAKATHRMALHRAMTMGTITVDRTAAARAKVRARVTISRSRSGLMVNRAGRGVAVGVAGVVAAAKVCRALGTQMAAAAT